MENKMAEWKLQGNKGLKIKLQECKDKNLKVFEFKDKKLKVLECKECKVPINSKQNKLKKQSSYTTWCELILRLFIFCVTLYLDWDFKQEYGENSKKIPIGHELNQVVK